MACRIPVHLPRQQCQQQLTFYKSAILCTVVIVCTLTSITQSVSATPTTSSNNNNNLNAQLLRNSQIRGTRGIGNSPLRNHIRPTNNNYHFLEQQNEYDSSSSGVSILDDDTLRLSLAIDDETAGEGLSAPSLHTLEPKVYLRVSGESGMIKPEDDLKQENSNNEVIIRQSSYRFPSFRASSSPHPNNIHRVEQGADLHYESNEEEDHEPVGGEGEEEDDEMSDNYHHHYPYIESYREKYVKPDFDQLIPSVVTTTPPTPTPQPTVLASKPAALSSSSAKSRQQEWTDIIAQVTTPSSVNEINPSASEHRLADFHFRANYPTYFYHKYSAYSEDDLENVADLDDEHSKYFVKTRPRSVATAGSNLYNNFYYEPPSFSTKSVPIPVKTNKEKVVFAAAKPTEDPHPLYTTAREQVENKDQSPQIFHELHDEEPQQDSPVMSPLSSNFTSQVPILTPKQINSDREAGVTANQSSNDSNDDYSNESILKTSASSSAATLNRNQAEQYQREIVQYVNHGVGKGETKGKSSAETLDVSTSQSVLSKVTLNNPHHPQLVIIKAEPIKPALATPAHDLTSDDDEAHDYHKDDDESNGDTSNEGNDVSTNAVVTSTPATVTTTTDATSIPGIPGIDYPILGEIPQTGFDCQKQRYKGFFADIDAKCQVWSAFVLYQVFYDYWVKLSNKQKNMKVWPSTRIFAIVARI